MIIREANFQTIVKIKGKALTTLIIMQISNFQMKNLEKFSRDLITTDLK